MTTIGKTTNVGGPISTGDVGGPTEAQTRSGIAGNSGPAPDVSTFDVGSIMLALRAFTPELADGDFETRLAAITAKMKEVAGEVNTDRVQNEQENKRLNMKENQAKIEESERKLQEAQEKRESGDIGDKIALAFQALGALLMIALGALLAVIPGAQALGAVMIASGILMAISVVNSIVSQCNEGAGILGSIAKAAGASDDVVMGLDIAFTVVLAIAAIAVAFINPTSLATGVAAAAAAAVRAAGQAANIATSVGAGAATVASKAYGLSAAEDTKQGQDLKADTMDMQAMMQMLDDIIDQALAMLMDASGRFNAVMDSLTEMMNDTGATLASTRFAG